MQWLAVGAVGCVARTYLSVAKRSASCGNRPFCGIVISLISCVKRSVAVGKANEPTNQCTACYGFVRRGVLLLLLPTESRL